MKAQHIISITIGGLLLAGGFFLVAAHKEIAIEAVGKQQLAIDILSGSRVYSDAAMSVLGIGVGTGIVGFLVVILGVIFGLKGKRAAAVQND